MLPFSLQVCDLMFWEGELILYLCSVLSRQNRILLKSAAEMNTKHVYEFVAAACPAIAFFFSSLFSSDSFTFVFSFREMMDGPVLLDLMSSFHFLSQLHGWLTVCPKGAVFIVHHASFDFADLRRG